MNTARTSERGWLAACGAWTLACAVSFVALGDAEDPSRPRGRISPYKAEIVALEHLRAMGPSRAGHETVDAAIYRDRGSDRRVWLVLCDDERPSRLAHAVVVEVDAESGRVLRVRRPGGDGAAGGER